MALDATPAGTAAESYLAVAEADVIAQGSPADPEVATWLDAATTSDMKEDALRAGTSQLDAILASGWPRFRQAQALRFPRSIDHDAADEAVPLIPSPLGRATAAQARYLLYDRNQLVAARAAAARGEAVVIAQISPLARHELTAFRLLDRPRQSSSARIASGFAT